MPSFCVVDKCCDKYGHSESISFHKFPFKRKDLLQAWIAFTQRGPDWKPTKWSAICSQHFTPDDFNCANSRKLLKKTAVPTVRVLRQRQSAGMQEKRIKVQGAAEHGSDNERGGDDEELDETQQAVATLCPKVNCRLCGINASSACTFSSNFEIFGMIQKCFPTLNIQQDDNLPKDMCNACLKRLRSFSEFIDKVLETQRELQQKFRPEKLTKQSLEPRSLKIKQEPIVKVKQEVAEGLESFIADDLDAAMDECCEPDNDSASVDQKYGFCDFPMLNAQDIINNCDIMEIINLDDPFINIPDDDTATINATVQQLEKSYLPSAHQLLQTHMLIDEHNYACPAEDLKEEWQIKKCCKTEEADAVEKELYEQLEAVEAHPEDELQQSGSMEMEMNGNSMTTVDCMKAAGDEQRSARPIVTSVSAIAESRLQLNNSAVPLTSEMNRNNNNNNNNNKIVVTSISEMLPASNLPQPTVASTTSSLHTKENMSSTSKPNIVVLNESIVKSTEAFQLHACAICQLKFFSIDSLQQHVSLSHMHSGNSMGNGTTLPMVTLPIENLPASSEPRVELNSDETHLMNSMQKPNKLGGDYNLLLNEDSQNLAESVDTSNALSEQLRNLQSWQLNMKTLHLNAFINNWNQSGGGSDFQQEAGHHHQLLAANDLNQVAAAAQDNSAAQQIEEIKLQLKADEAIFKQHSQITSKKRRSTRSLPKRRPIKRRKKIAEQQLRLAKVLEPLQDLSRVKNSAGVSATKASSLSQQIEVDYKTLQMRYSQLLRKCKKLQENCHLLYKTKGNLNASLTGHKFGANTTTTTTSTSMIRPNYQCAHCNSYFSNIYQLLQHRQKFHRPAKLYSAFSASCHGCEKYFLSKVALHNHMKYICQSLSLRWFKTQLQTFKCRHCRSISFTHWRLYRNHEISCERRMKLQQLRKVNKCSECPRHFAQLQKLALHLEVKHQLRWNLKCLHCTRKFSCLSALMEHHAKLSCRVNPASDCTVLCCTCRQYFQHYNQLLCHKNCKNQLLAEKMPRPPKLAEFACNQCPKVFTSSNNLSQHRITHTQGRKHKCGLCHRAFKRRGGLTQHMKSFHLQLRPYECPVCKYRFALKCDMQRCKHSMLQKRFFDGPVSAVEE